MYCSFAFVLEKTKLMYNTEVMNTERKTDLKKDANITVRLALAIGLIFFNERNKYYDKTVFSNNVSVRYYRIIYFIFLL